jgi:hypothetical protein
MPLRYTLMIITLIGAGAFAFFGIEEYSLASRSSDQPEEISLQQLINRGGSGNPNIVLKDFTICEDFLHAGKLTGWKKVWVPIVPKEAHEVDGSKAVHAFIFSETVRNEKELFERFDRPKLRGMIDPLAAKPNILGSVLLKRKYPGTDPQKCIIITEGKEPAGILKLVLLGLGFVVCLGLTGGIWYLAKVSDSIEVAPPKAEAESTSTNGGSGEPPLDVLPAD